MYLFLKAVVGGAAVGGSTYADRKLLDFFSFSPRLLCLYMKSTDLVILFHRKWKRTFDWRLWRKWSR